MSGTDPTASDLGITNAEARERNERTGAEHRRRRHAREAGHRTLCAECRDHVDHCDACRSAYRVSGAGETWPPSSGTLK